jgi:hypothetical protein
VPGSSGNPAGRGPGRPSEEVNQLADQAIEAVLQHDMDVVRRATAPQKGEAKPARAEVQKALDRLSRVGARWVTTRTETDVSIMSPEQQAALQELGESLTPEQARLLHRVDDTDRPRLSDGRAGRRDSE